MPLADIIKRKSINMKDILLEDNKPKVNKGDIESLLWYLRTSIEDDPTIERLVQVSVVLKELYAEGIQVADDLLSFTIQGQDSLYEEHSLPAFRKFLSASHTSLR